MKILVTTKIRQELEQNLVSENIIYRPDLNNGGVSSLGPALEQIQPDAIVVGQSANPDSLRDWSRSNGDRLVVFASPLAAGNMEVNSLPPENGVQSRYVTGDAADPELEAFTITERWNAHRLPRMLLANSNNKPAEISMVGTGIVNLICALRLNRAGYRVRIYDARPDPRIQADWKDYGCTFSGNDARIFSLTEARNHHVRPIGTGPNPVFRQGIADQGWLCCSAEVLSQQDEQWIDEFERVPSWLTTSFDEDIIEFNRQSGDLWKMLLEESPELFVDVGFRPQLTRLYASDAKLKKAKVGESRIGSLIYEIDLQTLAGESSCFAEAVASGEIAGGLKVKGFSVNIHKFGRSLIKHLAAEGVDFMWKTPITRILFQDDGTVRGLQVGGRVLTADHYVLSPGAFGDSLLEGTRAAGKIAAVVGMWITIPNNAPRLEVPLKISRAGYASDGAAEGANVIPGVDESGQEVLYVSSGHGFIGCNLDNLENAYLDDLAEAARDTARRYFPSKFAAALKSDLTASTVRHCIRPWTPTGLGIFESINTNSGGLAVITGGNSTGGFAQAPSIAEAVHAALEGKSNPMHGLYHPDRLNDFLGCRG